MPNFAHPLLNELPEEVKSLEDAESVWLTVLVLWTLEKDYKSLEGEWMLIAQKAKSFLKKKGIKAAELSKLFALISS